MDSLQKKDLNLDINSDHLASKEESIILENEEQKIAKEEEKTGFSEGNHQEEGNVSLFFSKKPRRLNNPLHILIQECSRQYIITCFSKKQESCQRQLISDLNKLKDDLKLFCSYDVLESAKASISSQNKKSTLENINLDSEIINLRFDETDAIIKSFSDAIDELYYENSKKSKDALDDLNLESVNKSLKIWYELAASSRPKNETKRFLKNAPREPKNMEQKRTMPSNRGSRYRDKKHLQYIDNSQVNHYDDSRRGRGRQEARKKFRNVSMDHNYRNKGSLPVDKNQNENSFNNASNFIPSYIHNFQHSTLPYNNYIPQNYTDYNHVQSSVNTASYPIQYNNAYYNYVTSQNAQYGTPLINNQYQKLPNYSEAGHSNVHQFQSLQGNVSFTSEQKGRHQHLPLPSDFMLGPMEGTRIEMPEPHHVLGIIKGMVIRDGQGNFGISKYSFISI
ncbi:hypothetical protein PCK1_000995 [Pneumocystis canis]|nr:hypothetical protein PCK1_000995 [Pneumocystis canis]